jgi:uncharacterized protein
MYVERAIDAELASWAGAPDRRPLVLRGARQVGKTEAVRRLAGRFEAAVELNLERRADARLVEGSESPEELLLALRVRHGWARLPARLLLFLDEIQESPRAVEWLRFFYEDHPEIAVVAAGSLMEVRLTDRDFSFPVGRVTFRYLHPFGFFDFLRATGRDVLRETLREAAEDLRGVPLAVHEQALHALRNYLLVGGMPAAVAAWVQNEDPIQARQIQSDLLQAFAEDLHKYRGIRDPQPLAAAFEALPQHYGARFKYESFAPGHRSAQMKASLDKLEAAMLIDRALPTSSYAPPYQRRPRSAAKLIPLDTGVALASAGTPFDELRRADPLTVLGGRATEMLVGQQLRAHRLRDRDPLWFWVAESSRANAEVDFLVEAVPVEVKAGKSGTLKSMHQFLARGGGRVGVRLHSGSFADQTHSVHLPGRGDFTYRLVSLPLYLAETLSLFGPPGA